MDNAKLAWELLNRDDKRRLAVLLALMLVNGALEMCGMGLIFPYIQIIGDPVLIQSNPSFANVSRFFGSGGSDRFIVALSLLLLAVFIFKNLFGLFLQSLLLRFAFLKQLDLGNMQMRTCIVRPYEYFLSHNSSDIVRNLTAAIPNVSTGVIVSWLNLLTEVAMVAAVLGLIIYVQPVAALIAIGVIGPCSFLLFRSCKNRILAYGTEQNREFGSMVKHSTEALQGIKEIKASGRGDYFVDRYLESARRYLRALRHYCFVVNIPRAFLEVMMIAAITLVVLATLYFAHDNLHQIVPLLAVYAAAGVRVLPAFNRIIIATNGIRFHNASLLVVVAEYRECRRLDALRPVTGESIAPAWRFRESVALQDVGFSYAGSAGALFDGLTMRIRCGESVAFIGPSGSGKSTLVDLVLGLLSPSRGNIRVDGRDISEHLPAWQRQIGYIPQQIYLVDDSLVRNVALGVTDDEVDVAKLQRVIVMADLADLVDQLPEGMNTLIGEHGVMLSGGQRQRIGIARALYREPAFLIMDEATSALDNVSEKRVIEAVSSLGDSVTVVMVAHRLSTVQYCDRVYLLEKGRIVDAGSYGEIAERHPYFVNPRGEEVEAMASQV